MPIQLSLEKEIMHRFNSIACEVESVSLAAVSIANARRFFATVYHQQPAFYNETF